MSHFRPAAFTQDVKHRTYQLSTSAVRRIEKAERRAHGEKMLRGITNAARKIKRSKLGNFPDEAAWQSARKRFVYGVLLAANEFAYKKAVKNLARFEKEKHHRHLTPPKGRTKNKGWIKDQLRSLAIFSMWNKGGSKCTYTKALSKRSSSSAESSPST